jgi:hypothetical protein
MDKPLWSLTQGSIEYGDPFFYDNWNDFIQGEPWNSNVLSGTIPTFWKVYHPDDPDFDDEYDITSLGLVYTSLAPLRAISVQIELDPNEDQRKIERWLTRHGFLDRGG